jgi:RHS repeat-associated protein
MTNETVTKSGRFYCVSVTPDICKTPVGASTPPLPYTIVGEFADATGASPNVKSHSEPVVLHGRTTIPSVKGDAAGSAGGVKSGTVGKQVDTKAFSATHHANGTDLVQVGREVWMNARNTVGKIYERGGEAARPLLDKLDKAVEEAQAEARASLKSVAQAYRDDVSAPMHDIGGRLMDVGGKVAAAGAVTAGAGAVASATGVGLVVGAPMAAGGAAVAGVGGTAVAGGAAVETTATVLDQTAEYVITGKTPKILDAALDSATNIAEGVLFRKLGPVGRWLSSKTKGLGRKAIKKLEPGKPPLTPPKPPSKPPAAHDDDGKSRGKKEPKSEPPSECCPKNTAPAGKPVKGKKPIHFGTGQEVLHQTDFVTTGVIPIDWTRCYRSGAETEDRGLLGARWSSAFTTSVSLTAQGCVVHDETGRALRLPLMAPGESHDEQSEGFTLKREDVDSFTLTWGDGSRDTFSRGLDGYLPHGYDGVNPMLDAGAAVRTERFVLTRSTDRDGHGIGIALWPAALPGAVLLRVTSDDGTVIEAMRDDLVDADASPRIGRVEEVLDDGTRICHVRYAYALDPANSFDLVSQTNVLGDARTYAYHHHLLTACTSYTGFLQVVEWVSLASLRARWSGSTLDDAELAAEYPVTPETSYQARAIASRAADGSEGAGLTLHYLDIDTTRVIENGDVLDYTFDRNWLVTGVKRVTNGGAVLLGTREWDRNGLLLAERDGLGRTARFAYDAAGNLTSSKDAAGHSTHIAYNSANQPVSITDPMGHVTQRSYDAAGRLASVTNALGHTTGYCYDEHGRLVEQIDAKGRSNRFEYDKAGRLRTSTDCSGHATKYRYDERGRIAAVIHAEAAPGQQTRYTYDTLGRLVTLTRPDGTSESYAYDANGNLLMHTDAMGHQTRYRYNGQGLLTERIDAIGQTVRYRYDKALRLVELVNAKDERYVLAYDAEGALISETGFDGKVTTYTYDKAGQLTASECAGQRTDLIRDSRGLLLAKMNADGIVRFAYDELGRMVAVAAPQAEHRFMYDALGQLVEERAGYYLVTTPAATPVDGSRVPDAAFVMTHAYDELGNRISTTLPNGRRVDTLRYGSGHWHSMLWQGKAIVDVERDKLHRERKRQLGRGPETQRMVAYREYDPQSRVSAMTLTGPSVGTRARLIRERQFAYDAAGNLLSIHVGGDAHDGSAGVLTYTYDPVGQLLSAVQPGLTETFVFDPAGNLLDAGPVQSGSAHGPVAGASQTGVLKLPVITANLLQSLHGHSYRYDAQGNVVQKHSSAGASGYGSPSSELTLEYDADNRLRRSVRTQHLVRHTAEYFYDAFSRRVAKRVVIDNWQSIQKFECDVADPKITATTLFVWDGDVLAQELSEDYNVTYLYEPSTFVPICRIVSHQGYIAGTHKFGICAAVKPSDLSYCYSNESSIPADIKRISAIRLFCVEQWNPCVPESAAIHTAQKNAYNALEQEHQTEWQRRLFYAEALAVDDQIHYYNCDHLGTPREIFDTTGRVIWARRSSAWGRLLKTADPSVTEMATEELPQPINFQGQYQDSETGLFYNRYRYYDPDCGRYISPDPIGILGGLNAYAYAPSSTNWIDPYGLEKTCPLHFACDPCSGRDPAAEARKWQGPANDPYVGIDSYKNVVIAKGTVIYTLYPHGPNPGNYFVSGSTLLTTGTAREFNDSVQVAHAGNSKHRGVRPMRTKVHAYVVKDDICVAEGVAMMNPNFGKGGSTQYFLENRDKVNILDTDKIISFKK